ncbi:hypothetical protein ACFOOM_24535 [Streptomyces echinoruber]|uniref:Uncharacterized protein n=1 Tax=Streptomyces echinoruber TaxID=68898 RepID=A0A918VCB2_9ACTN|nr:hypothetical protein [Streptomyces echinoruber]GGZ87296.1 hypothetical protein GCM10010389_27070 [Streptomyces echinoruber]
MSGFQDRDAVHQVVFRWNGNQDRQGTGMKAVAHSCSAERADELGKELGSLLWLRGTAARPSVVRTLSRDGEVLLVQRWPTTDPGGRPSTVSHVLVGDPVALKTRQCLGLAWGRGWCRQEKAEQASGPQPVVDCAELDAIARRRLPRMAERLPTVRHALVLATAELLRDPARRVSLLLEEETPRGWPDRAAVPLVYFGLFLIFGDWLPGPWTFATYDAVDTHPLRLMSVPRWEPDTGGFGPLARIEARQRAQYGFEHTAAAQLVKLLPKHPEAESGVPQLVEDLADGVALDWERRRARLGDILGIDGPPSGRPPAALVPRPAQGDPTARRDRAGGSDAGTGRSPTGFMGPDPGRGAGSDVERDSGPDLERGAGRDLEQGAGRDLAWGGEQGAGRDLAWRGEQGPGRDLVPDRERNFPRDPVRDREFEPVPAPVPDRDFGFGRGFGWDGGQESERGLGGGVGRGPGRDPERDVGRDVGRDIEHEGSVHAPGGPVGAAPGVGSAAAGPSMPAVREAHPLHQELCGLRPADGTQRGRLREELSRQPDAFLLGEVRSSALPPHSLGLVLEELGKPHRLQVRDEKTRRALCEEVLKQGLCFPPRKPAGSDFAEAEQAARVFHWAVAPLARDKHYGHLLQEGFRLLRGDTRVTTANWRERTLLRPPDGRVPDLPPELWSQILRDEMAMRTGTPPAQPQPHQYSEVRPRSRPYPAPHTTLTPPAPEPPPPQPSTAGGRLHAPVSRLADLMTDPGCVIGTGLFVIVAVLVVILLMLV